MLMSNHNRLAKLRYMDGTFRILTAGDHVLCAVSGQHIALDDLRYWSVAKQEAYASAAVSLSRELDLNPALRSRSMAAAQS